MDTTVMLEGQALSSAYEDLEAIGSQTITRVLRDALELMLEGPAADEGMPYGIRVDLRFNDPRNRRRFTAAAIGGWSEDIAVRARPIQYEGEVTYWMGNGHYTVGDVDINEKITDRLQMLLAEYIDQGEPVEVELRLQVEANPTMLGIADPWEATDAMLAEEF